MKAPYGADRPEEEDAEPMHDLLQLVYPTAWGKVHAKYSSLLELYDLMMTEERTVGEVREAVFEQVRDCVLEP